MLSIGISAPSTARAGAPRHPYFGGYALISALTVLLALVSPIAPPKMAAQLVSFPLYLCVVLWIFHARNVARVWGWLVLWTLVAVALCWWKLKGGAS